MSIKNGCKSKKVPYILAYVGFFLYLCARFDIHTVYDGFREGGIKRESGVNPGLSRSCEYQAFSYQPLVVSQRFYQ